MTPTSRGRLTGRTKNLSRNEMKPSFGGVCGKKWANNTYFGSRYRTEKICSNFPCVLYAEQHICSLNTSKALIILIIRLKPLRTLLDSYISAGQTEKKETNVGKRSRPRKREQERPHQGTTHFFVHSLAIFGAHKTFL